MMGRFPTPAALGFKTLVPFMNQMATLPLVVSRHRTSLLPSPLKSPDPAILKLVVTFPTPALLRFKIVGPFISQLVMLQLVSRQRMSHLPSPLKSPVPTMDQVVATFPTPAALGFKTVVPFISQIATLPLVSRRRCDNHVFVRRLWPARLTNRNNDNHDLSVQVVLRGGVDGGRSQVRHDHRGSLQQ